MSIDAMKQGIQPAVMSTFRDLGRSKWSDADAHSDESTWTHCRLCDINPGCPHGYSTFYLARAGTSRPPIRTTKTTRRSYLGEVVEGQSQCSWAIAFIAGQICNVAAAIFPAKSTGLLILSINDVDLPILHAKTPHGAVGDM